ncbi:MAG: FtsX-like permease family protein [Colwellia sp.]|nr:FtsX-like permease family protein [Colwellia sp.]
MDVRKIWWQTTNGMLIGKLSIDNYANQAAQIFSTLINELWLEAIVGDERFTGKTQKIALHSFKKVIVGDNKKVVYLLLAGIIGLLIIAFSNIANLMMSRAMTQQRIMTIHAAIGAKRANIFSALLSESLILMCFSMLIALIVSFVGFELIERFFGASLSRSAEMSNNLFTVGISVVILLVLSLLLATVATKTVIQSQLFATLNTGGKGIGSQVSKLFRQLLIICQVTVASVLIFISATLFKESFYSINTSSGLNVSNVMALTLASSTSDVPSAEQAIPVLDEIKEKLSFLPQVHAISHTKSPFESFERWWPGLTTLEDNQKLNVVYRVVDEQYFSLLSQQHILGNVFDKNDVLEQSNVMIVNDMVAKRLEPSGQVLGKKVFFRDDRIFTIIGVVKGVHLPAEKDIGERVYIPRSAVYDLTTREKLSLVIKLKENQQLTRQQVVNTIKEVSSSFSVKSLESLSDTRFQRLFNQYVTTMVTAILTVLSLVLAAIGLYGILSYSSQMRRFEIGTRLAIGAKGKDIVILIIKENLVPLIVGIAVSFIVVWGLYLNFNEYLPVDFVAEIVTLFVMTVCLIGIISFIACYLPLRQYINQPAIHSLKGSE